MFIESVRVILGCFALIGRPGSAGLNGDAPGARLERLAGRCEEWIGRTRSDGGNMIVEYVGPVGMASTTSDPLKDRRELGVDMPVIDCHVVPNQMALQQHLPTHIKALGRRLTGECHNHLTDHLIHIQRRPLQIRTK